MVPELSPRMNKCAAHVLENLPGFILNPKFRENVGLLRITFIDDPQETNRGWATPDGQIFINTARLARFCHSSPYSQFGGKSDLSPTGVVCHELGHIVHFMILGKRRMDLNSRIKQLWASDRKNGVTSYARTRYSEDFAEAHRLWATNPELLKKLSPERWELQHEVYLYLLGQSRSGYKIRKSDRGNLFLDLFKARL